MAETRNYKKSRRIAILLGIVAAVAVVGFGGLWLSHTFFKNNPQALEDAIVKQFRGKAGSVIANVPSRTGRYPGAVLAVSPAGSELLMRAVERPEQLPSTSGSLTGVEVAKRSAAWEIAGLAFGEKLEGRGEATVKIDLKDIRIFEQELSKLAEALRNDESVTHARASGQSVIVVTKAYEAIPLVTVRQQSDAKSEAWAKLKSELTKAKGQERNDGSVEFKSESPQVIAYETSEVRFVADNFAPGNLKLEFQPRKVVGETFPLAKPQDFGAKVESPGIAYAVIASPAYLAEKFGDLREATTSAGLVRKLLETAAATPLDTGLEPSARLTTEGFNSARKKLVELLKAKKPRAFVLYYVGHAVSGMAGAHYLVMGDYRGKLANDLKQSSPFVPAQGPTHPLAGSNINDIAKAVAAAGQEFAPSQPGLVSVSDLYSELAATGVPFALVIDGCFPATAMEQLRSELRFTPWGDYYGQAVIRDLEEYQKALRTYGEAPYLRSNNPVIFAARPGTLAPVVRNPFYDSDLVPGVGPLAAKLAGSYSFALENREDLSLGLWLRRITDFAGTGQIDLKGSISWSNFDKLRNIPMVTFSNNAQSR